MADGKPGNTETQHGENDYVIKTFLFGKIKVNGSQNGQKSVKKVPEVV